MREQFINYVCEKIDFYSKEEIIDIIANKELDFDLFSFDELILECFDNDIVAICPKCNELIYRVNGEYIYETGSTKYICEHCENEIYI